MSRQPIDPKDIRKGDLIRCEWDGPRSGLVSAEFVGHRDGYSLYPDAPMHYLLDRPTPPVTLPTEPTLGWATWSGGDYLAVWSPGASVLRATDNRGEATGDVEHVTAFIPATAAPTAALDALRASAKGTFTIGAMWDAIDTFLAAVDKANEATR